MDHLATRARPPETGAPGVGGSTPRLLVTALALLLALLLPASAVAADGSPNVELVDTIPHPIKERYDQTVPYGTDIDFAEVKGHRYALAGSELNGLTIIDVTRPQRAKVVAQYDCAISQGDPFVFTREDLKAARS